MVDTEKMGEVLTANWTKFIDFRKIGAVAIRLANQELGTQFSFAQTTSCSLFEITPKGFIIWMDITTPEGKITTELITSFSGDLISSKSIKLQ